MIVGAAVCPGAPFLIGGVADAVAARLSEVGRACAHSLSRLPAPDAVLLVAAGWPAGPAGGRDWRIIAPGSVISSTSIVRSDLPSGRSLPESPTADRVVIDPAVGTIVGTSLLAKDFSAVPIVAVEVNGDPAGAAGAAAVAMTGIDRVAVLVMADGSACHGDDAPGRRDDRSSMFDADLASALGAGDPAALAAACADRALAAQLIATVDPLAVLAQLTSDSPPDDAELMFSGAPLGVGYLIASWRWARG